MAALARGVLLSFLVGVTAFACSDDPTSQPGTGPDGIPTGNPNGVVDGAGCGKGFDCQSGVCTGGKCAVPTSTDKVRNGKETGLDCGGPDAPPCGGGQSCKAASDCASDECANGKCTGPVNPDQPTATDGKKNGDESDVDCGGTKTGAPACGTDKGCNAATDCESKVCSEAKKCSAPTGTDTVQNGDETDVDCGGITTGAPKCDAGKICKEHIDCKSDGCDDQKKCALSRSCAVLDGGRTCGTGEVGAAGAVHESCCVALPVPGGTKLDKYKITAGRMRAFIERVQGNVLGWYEANKATLDPKAPPQIEEFKATLPTDIDSPETGANYQLGAFIKLTDRPSTSQGCYVGNAGDKAYGSHTYWDGDVEGEDRAFDKAFLDRLPLNCVPYPLAAAFCAWDGGRLQTYEENAAAFGAGPYPWGATPEAGGFAEIAGVWQPYGPARPGVQPGACPGCDTTRMNWASNYQFPEGGIPAKDWDLAYFISAPGRFPGDVGPSGHLDIGGLMMEWTASPGIDRGAGNPATDAQYGAKRRWGLSGSWEGHGTFYDQWQFAVLTKYGKTTGRCARD